MPTTEISNGFVSAPEELYKFRYAPNYGGAPKEMQLLFMADNGEDDKDRVILTHEMDGKLKFIVRDDVRQIYHARTFERAWLPALSSTCDMRLYINSKVGVVCLGINGCSMGVCEVDPWHRGGQGLICYAEAGSLIIEFSVETFGENVREKEEEFEEAFEGIATGNLKMPRAALVAAGEFYIQYKNVSGGFGGKYKVSKLIVTRRLGDVFTKELEGSSAKSKETPNAKYTWGLVKR